MGIQRILQTLEWLSLVSPCDAVFLLSAESGAPNENDFDAAVDVLKEDAVEKTKVNGELHRDPPSFCLNIKGPPKEAFSWQVDNTLVCGELLAVDSFGK